MMQKWPWRKHWGPGALEGVSLSKLMMSWRKNCRFNFRSLKESTISTLWRVIHVLACFLFWGVSCFSLFKPFCLNIISKMFLTNQHFQSLQTRPCSWAFRTRFRETVGRAVVKCQTRSSHCLRWLKEERDEGSTKPAPAVRIIPVSKWLGSPPFISHEWPFGGEQPYLGDLLTMVINQLLNGIPSSKWIKKAPVP